MPYGQKRGEKCISIDIYALRANEKTKFKQFLNIGHIKLPNQVSSCNKNNPDQIKI
jgi:hypothetical protein